MAIESKLVDLDYRIESSFEIQSKRLEPRANDHRRTISVDTDRSRQSPLTIMRTPQSTLGTQTMKL